MSASNIKKTYTEDLRPLKIIAIVVTSDSLNMTLYCVLHTSTHVSDWHTHAYRATDVKNAVSVS